MFAAIESKDIDVKLIPKDDKESRVIIKNNTRKPLTVKLPDAFAGVPVLAQARGGGAAAGGANRTQQSVGGGMPIWSRSSIAVFPQAPAKAGGTALGRASSVV